MTPSRSAPWRPAAVVLVIAALAGNGLLIVTTLRTPAESVRDVPLADAARRWDAVRPLLVREGTTGYVVHPPPVTAAERAEAVLAFRLAQYAAIPAALEEGTGRPVVVLDAPPGPSARSSAALDGQMAGYTLERDFGNGIRVYRRAP